MRYILGHSVPWSDLVPASPCSRCYGLGIDRISGIFVSVIRPEIKYNTRRARKSGKIFVWISGGPTRLDIRISRSITLLNIRWMYIIQSNVCLSTILYINLKKLNTRIHKLNSINQKCISISSLVHITWYLCKMVAQNRLRTYEVK